MFKLIYRYSLKRTINYFAITAVILSITLLFTVNAVLKGFDDELQHLFRGSLSDILVQWHFTGPSSDRVASQLDDWDWSPALEGFGMVRTDLYLDRVSFKGVDPDLEIKLRQKMGISKINFEQLKSESSTTTSNPFEDMLGIGQQKETPAPALVGYVMADELGLRTGDKMRLFIFNRREQISERVLVVAGTFKTGIYEEDNGKIFLHIDEARKLTKHPTGFSYIQVVDNKTNSKKQLKEIFPSAVVNTWREKHQIRLRAITHERKLIALIMSMIVIVCGFGILAIQWSFVQEKTRDIGILRAIGFSRKQIFTIFLGVSWMVGLTGLFIGLLGGVGLSLNANALINATGWQPFPGDIYYHETLPVKMEWSDVIWISILSLSVTTLAGLLPAWRALKVEPIKAIAYE